MKLSSIINLFAEKIESFFSEPVIENFDSRKKISTLEKRIYSQGKNTTYEFEKLLRNIDIKQFDVSEKAVFQSVKSRIKGKKEFYPLAEILNDSDIDAISQNFGLHSNVANFILLEHLDDTDNSNLISQFFTYVEEVKNDLRNNWIIKLLIDFCVKKYNYLNNIHLQIPLISSYLAFFDQEFTLKRFEFYYVRINETFFSVNINISKNGRKIYGFIPAPC